MGIENKLNFYKKEVKSKEIKSIKPKAGVMNIGLNEKNEEANRIIKSIKNLNIIK